LEGPLLVLYILNILNQQEQLRHKFLYQVVWLANPQLLSLPAHIQVHDLDLLDNRLFLSSFRPFSSSQLIAIILDPALLDGVKVPHVVKHTLPILPKSQWLFPADTHRVMDMIRHHLDEGKGTDGIVAVIIQITALLLHVTDAGHGGGIHHLAMTTIEGDVVLPPVMVASETTLVLPLVKTIRELLETDCEEDILRIVLPLVKMIRELLETDCDEDILRIVLPNISGGHPQGYMELFELRGLLLLSTRNVLIVLRSSQADVQVHRAPPVSQHQPLEDQSMFKPTITTTEPPRLG